MFVPMISVFRPTISGHIEIKHEEVEETHYIDTPDGKGTEVKFPKACCCRLYRTAILLPKLLAQDSPAEQLANRQVVSEAFGDVLIAGLGIGMTTVAILQKPTVRTVTVVESDAEVLRVVGDVLKKLPDAQRKLGFVHADITEWKPYKRKWSTIWFDIWSSVDEETIPMINFLHKKYQKHKRPDGYMGSYKQQFLRNTRKDQRSPQKDWSDL
jgi:hypothetical protein